jgi:hypothetical protein
MTSGKEEKLYCTGCRATFRNPRHICEQKHDIIDGYTKELEPCVFSPLGQKLVRAYLKEIGG